MSASERIKSHATKTSANHLQGNEGARRKTERKLKGKRAFLFAGLLTAALFGAVVESADATLIWGWIGNATSNTINCNPNVSCFSAFVEIITVDSYVPGTRLDWQPSELTNPTILSATYRDRDIGLIDLDWRLHGITFELPAAAGQQEGDFRSTTAVFSSHTDSRWSFSTDSYSVSGVDGRWFGSVPAPATLVLLSLGLLLPRLMLRRKLACTGRR